MLDCDFEMNFTELERQTWLSVKAVINNFLGSKIQKPQAPDRQRVAKLPGNEIEHVTENSHNEFSLGLLPRKYGSC